ncbi:YcdB/YcdC domain-containing protein [Paenibacillus puldeungensis]|uniref:YcdB/YcdC domain-containing protein n=1 Tax=Paenibacillus puldeungensis TaxID=696536 RepID=A0ABW3S175_9BACL
MGRMKYLSRHFKIIENSGAAKFPKWSGKVAMTSLIALSLLLPQGVVLGASSSGTNSGSASGSSAVIPNTSEAKTPDPSKAKFSKEQVLAKVKELFPQLAKAKATSVQLGITNEFPAPKNQMIWDISWEFREGNMSHSFSSRVDAITGELVNIYLSMPETEGKSFYPPGVTEEKALEIAKAFIAKAAPSYSAKDLQLKEDYRYIGTKSLFGPVQYNFYFDVLINGLPSAGGGISVGMDGDGNITQFSKPSDRLEHPSAVPSITQAAAEKLFNEQFKVELGYFPIRKNGEISSWVLAWGASESAVSPIDAKSGKKINFRGVELPSESTSYDAIPAGKKAFIPRTSTVEMTEDEAVKAIQQVAQIPEGRTLNSKFLSNDYRDSNRQVWRLIWGGDNDLRMPFPMQTSAEVDALTGQIVQFSIEEYSTGKLQKPLPVPKGAVKLTKETAKKRAIDYINLLYPKADSNLKLVNQEADTSEKKNEDRYSYQFTRFYQGLPIRDGAVSLTIDAYGRLLFYNVSDREMPASVPAGNTATITEEKALGLYRQEYKPKLQYQSFGGHYIDGEYSEPVARLVYAPNAVNPERDSMVLDAVSGKWVATYDNFMLSGKVPTPKDIKGHKAEKELTTLVDYQVLTPDQDGNLKPDEAVTMGDWLKIMGKAENPNYEQYYFGDENGKKIFFGVAPESPYYQAVRYAVTRHWVQEDASLQVDAKLTREQLAVMLTIVLKYSKLATFLGQDTAVSQFSDAKSIKEPGAVALTVKLGLLEGQNGKFNPQQTVSKADIASVIMKLVNLQGKTDQQINQ